MPIENLIQRVYELPSIPKVVQELIADFSNDRANADSVSAKIQTDPVIAAKVLRMANSARYGAGRKVASLDAAVVLLGTDSLKTLVLASGVTATMKDIPGMNMKDFWRNSFMVANISKLLARFSPGLDPEVAFTCGMLHNIGIPLMTLAHTYDMQRMQEYVDKGAVRVKEEKAFFGFDNNEVGARLSEEWRFPQVIVDAIADQAAPLAHNPPNAYAAVICLAERIHEQLLSGKEPQEIVSKLPEDLTTAINLNSFKVFEQLANMLEAEDDIDELVA